MLHAASTQASAFTSASALNVYHLFLALAVMVTAAVVSGALLFIRWTTVQKAGPSSKPADTSCTADPMEEDPVECGSPCASDATYSSAGGSSKDAGEPTPLKRSASPPTLAPSCLLAAGRPAKESPTDPAPELLVFTSSRTNTTPGARKTASVPKPCWRYSFGKAFTATDAPTAAAAGRSPADGKENAGGSVLLPSKHMPSRLFERMSKRRKKDAVLGSSPPQPPPVLAGNKHNLTALPATQQSPKKPKILQLDAPPFGSPVASPLQPLLSHHQNPLHSVEAFPPRAHLRRAAAAPAVLSSSAPTFSFMPASPPTAAFLAPPPPSAAGTLFGTSFPPSSGSPFTVAPLSIPPAFSSPALSLASSPSPAPSPAIAPFTSLPAPALTITLPAGPPPAPASSPTSGAPPAVFPLLGAQSNPASPASAAPQHAPVIFTATPSPAAPQLPAPTAPPPPSSAAGSKRRTEGQASATASADEDDDAKVSEQPAKRKGRSS